MQIRPVVTGHIASTGLAKVSRSQPWPVFGAEDHRQIRNYKDKNKDNDNALKRLKRKFTPSWETRQDLKKIGIGGAVAIGGTTVINALPLGPVGDFGSLLALWGGVWYALPAAINIFRRNKNTKL